ncbi:MAG: DUF4113 domain-containing protein [Gammaproteobacteria bacterium]|nr:MAG: DUF4113 domain-containing protein [Gammaproteobacteria bacterium]
MDRGEVAISEGAERVSGGPRRGTLRCLAEGLVQPWRMRRERKTPGYTTDWRELPVVGLGARHPHYTHVHRLNNATT